MEVHHEVEHLDINTGGIGGDPVSGLIAGASELVPGHLILEAIEDTEKFAPGISEGGGSGGHH